MAQPTFLFADNFEDGTIDAWDTGESDSANQLSVAHYTTLARTPGLPMPYSGGAYCLRAAMRNDNAGNASITDTGIDITDGQTFWFHFNIWFSPLFGSTGDDYVAFLELQKADNAIVNQIGAFIDTSTGLSHWVVGGSGLATGTQAVGNIELGKWTTVEAKVNVQTAAATGEIELYITPEGGTPSSTAHATYGTYQAGGAVTHGVLGVTQKITGMSGTVLIDNFQMRTTNRIWPSKNRFPSTKTMNQSGHAFVGPGKVCGVTLSASAGTDNIISIYDTDTAQKHDGLKKLVLANVSNNEVISSDREFEVTRGCYVEITGTASPEVTVNIENAPAWFSDGNMRNFALQRSLQP